MITLLLTILAYSTQNEALFSGSVPEEVPTFQATVRGAEPFFAGVRVNDKWVDDPGMEIGPRQEVELVPDAPWRAPETYRILYSKVDLKYEATAMRRDRLQKTLAAQGYSLRETANGWWPVRDSDAQYAERLRKMQTNAGQTVEAVPLPELFPAQTVQDTAAATTTRRRLMVLMIAIPLACVAAMALVAKKLVLDGSFQKA